MTEAGAAQANELADKFKDIPLERIFVSELMRTQETAAVINRFHGVGIEVAASLNDHRSGFEGKSAKLLFDALDASEDRWTAHFNDGESIEDMKRRVASFIDDLRTRQLDTILVVTSQWIIYSAVAIIRGIPNEEAWGLDIEPGDYLELELSTEPELELNR